MRDPYTNTQNVLRHAQNPCVAMQRIAIAFPSPLLSLKATFATATFPQSRRPTTTTTHTQTATALALGFLSKLSRNKS